MVITMAVTFQFPNIEPLHFILIIHLTTAIRRSKKATKYRVQQQHPSQQSKQNNNRKITHVLFSYCYGMHANRRVDTEQAS